MGNNLVSPSIESVRSTTFLREYCRCQLQQLNESYEYWINSDIDLNAQMTFDNFESIFGHLVDDAEQHYSNFRQNVTFCGILDVFIVFALLSNDSMKSKVRFIFDLTKEKREKLKLDSVLHLLYRVVAGMKAVCDFPIPSRLEAFSFLEKSLDQFSQRRALSLQQAAAVAGKRKSSVIDQSIASSTADESSYSMMDIWQWSQDVDQISSFLAAIQEMLKKSDRSTRGGRRRCRGHGEGGSEESIAGTAGAADNAVAVSGLFSDRTMPSTVTTVIEAMKPSIFSRARHPLWCHQINSLVDASWLDELPAMGSNECVFTALEHLVLSDQRAVPVYERSDPSDIAFYAAQMKRSYHQAQVDSIRRNFFFHFEERFFGVVDYFSIMALVLQCCPPGVYQQVVQEEEQAKIRKLLRDMDASQDDFDSSAGAAGLAARLHSMQLSADSRDSNDSISAAGLSGSISINRNGSSGSPHGRRNIANDANSIVMMLSANSAKLRKRNRRDAHSQWQMTGQAVARCPLSTVITELLYGKPRQMGPYVRDSILSVDHFTYNLVDMVARGYAYVPIASSLEYPNHVSHLLSAVDVAVYLRERASELLGVSAHVPVMQSGLAKLPMTIDMNTNLASALYKMCAYNVDAAVILDAHGKVGGILEPTFLADFWKMWFSHQQEARQSFSRHSACTYSTTTTTTNLAAAAGTAAVSGAVTGTVSGTGGSTSATTLPTAAETGAGAAVSVAASSVGTQWAGSTSITAGHRGSAGESEEESEEAAAGLSAEAFAALQRSYAEGGHVPFDPLDDEHAAFSPSFSIFSCLLSPLKHCEVIGINIVDFELYTGIKNAPLSSAGSRIRAGSALSAGLAGWVSGSGSGSAGGVGIGLMGGSRSGDNDDNNGEKNGNNKRDGGGKNPSSLQERGEGGDGTSRPGTVAEDGDRDSDSDSSSSDSSRAGRENKQKIENGPKKENSKKTARKGKRQKGKSRKKGGTDSDVSAVGAAAAGGGGGGGGGGAVAPVAAKKAGKASAASPKATVAAAVAAKAATAAVEVAVAEGAQSASPQKVPVTSSGATSSHADAANITSTTTNASGSGGRGSPRNKRGLQIEVLDSNTEPILPASAGRTSTGKTSAASTSSPTQPLPQYTGKGTGTAAASAGAAGLNLPLPIGGTATVIATATATAPGTQGAPMSPTSKALSRAAAARARAQMLKRRLIEAKHAKAESDIKAQQSRKLEKWFRDQLILTPTDTIMHALELMVLSKRSRAFVASLKGEPLAVITLQDICKELVLQEARIKAAQQEMQKKEESCRRRAGK